MPLTPPPRPPDDPAAGWVAWTLAAALFASAAALSLYQAFLSWHPR